MYEEVPPSNNILDPEDRLIWKQKKSEFEYWRLLPGFCGLLTVREDLHDSVYLTWFGSKEAEGLPKRILDPKFWPKGNTKFNEKFSEEVERTLHEAWPSFEKDGIELAVNVLLATPRGSTAVADMLTLFYIEHQAKIDLIMVRFFACKVFEIQPELDWILERAMGDAALTKMMDRLFFEWRIDDPRLKRRVEVIGEKCIYVGCKFFDFFFEGILKKNYEIAKLRLEGDQDDHLNSEANSDSGGGNKSKPRTPEGS
jgi:hypothetical protein